MIIIFNRFKTLIIFHSLKKFIFWIYLIFLVNLTIFNIYNKKSKTKFSIYRNKTKNIGKNINVAKIQEEKINIEEKIEDEG